MNEATTGGGPPPAAKAVKAKTEARSDRSGHAWTEAEDSALIGRFDGAITDLAARHRRSVRAVKLRLARHGRVPEPPPRGRDRIVFDAEMLQRTIQDAITTMPGLRRSELVGLLRGGDSNRVHGAHDHGWYGRHRDLPRWCVADHVGYLVVTGRIVDQGDALYPAPKVEQDSTTACT